VQRGIFVSLLALCLAAVSWAQLKITDSLPAVTDVALPTFARDVSPIVQSRCCGCHRADGSAPFSLHAYGDVRKKAKQIVEVTRSRYMPPWLPVQSHIRFANERHMSEQEIATLARWFETGMLEGDTTKLPPRQDSRFRWQLGEPDLVLMLQTPFELRADGPDVFRNFVLPAHVSGKKFVRTVAILPSNSRAVHHIIGLIDRTRTARRRDAEDDDLGFAGMDFGQAEIPSGQSMLWSPGKVPSSGRPGIAWQIDSKTDIVLQLHMVPTGKPESIQPRIGLYFVKAAPSLHPISILLEATSIDIAAGTKPYEVLDQITLPVDVKLLSVYPHAHYLARRMECVAVLPNGNQQLLMLIDDWDFNWQDEYEFAEPVALPKGTVVKMQFTYDNSTENVRNPNSPPRRVVLGNRSTDEMGSLLLQLLTNSEQDWAAMDESRWRQKLLSTPLHPTANQNLGNIYASRGDYDRALLCYRRALQVAPQDCVAHGNIACTLSEMGDNVLAESHFQRAIELNPEYALGHCHWGAALMRQGRIPEAIEKLNKALELWPEFPEARLNLGEAELRRGNVAQAKDHFSLATSQFPDYALAHFNLGTVLMNSQQYTEATKCFRRAIQIDDQFAEAFNNLGIVLLGQGELLDAAEQFRKSIALDPSYENPRQNLKIVEQQTWDIRKSN